GALHRRAVQRLEAVETPAAHGRGQAAARQVRRARAPGGGRGAAEERPAEQRHQAFATGVSGGFFSIMPMRVASQTTTSFWFKPTCLTVTMPACGYFFDSRRSSTSVRTLTVSPGKSGLGKVIFSKPRFPIVVPCVSSPTMTPHTRPSVYML